MQITIANITPFLDTPIPSDKTTTVTAWLTAISAQLNKTFGLGDTLDANVAPAVYDIVASIILRRLSRGAVGEGNGRIKAQSTLSSSVQYNTDVTSLTGWYQGSEWADLSALLGNGGTLSSVTLSAPDGIRYGNLARHNDLDAEDWERTEGVII